ncbi:hypothetical protein A9264_03665 [Vibrio sp. UCD-FRSSP16_10]|uniref:SPOR domain-containing protein n=1 Tax=unclassified Vibrio TaxID=2614977 RepID=UPI00080147E9|nr:MULTISPECIES: SPOR domain-containing protein [unclassified Vibrio]OBT10068.1 hypothetical protein A9260_05115 [Vibrio sp. UCD-FRSSP16_30]OBT18858.1 hypothetical protein A9264_03665 [Vibrio sp. UCD-FRSSP16_10]
MSRAQEAKSLELQSQTLLLDKLRLMTRFGSNLVTLIGSGGSGKSWLLERYFSKYITAQHKAKLTGDASTSKCDMKRTLLAQLSPNTVFDSSLSTFEHLDNEFGLQSLEFVILVDDAGLYTEDVLLSLWYLVERIQAHPTWTLSLIMACGPDLLSKKILPLSHRFNVQPSQLNIAPLSPKEVDFFLELMVLRQFESLKKRDNIRKKANRGVQYPGELIALGSKLKSTKSRLSSHNGSAKSAVIAILLILAFALLAWWVFFKSNQADEIKSVPASTDSTEQALLQPQLGEPTDVADFSAVEEDTLVEDTQQLPPPVTGKTITLDDNSHGQERVVVPDAVVDSLIDTESNVVKPKLEAAVKPTALDKNNALVHFSFARDELLAISSKRYTVQLGALPTMAEVQSFIDEHQLQSETRIYPTLRSGKKVYIITYHDFRFVKQASKAIEQLPAAVQAVGPWVKSMAQVHKEIEVGK